ncbi:MAG: phosphoribosylanthranilate isomerase [Chloroflexota bacterium]
MIIQLYTMQSPAEALACVDAGADHVGITPPQGLPGELPTLEAMRDIVDAVGDRARCVALTVDMDPARIVTMVELVRPSILHLCPLAERITPRDVGAIRARLPGVPIMTAVSVTGLESVRVARDYAEVSDYLILDTQAAGIPGIGASGKTHDWSVSRDIVDSVRVPVILAGGLSAENVRQAIRAVAPWGVDSLTHTNRALDGGGFCKDLERVAAFVAAARHA